MCTYRLPTSITKNTYRRPWVSAQSMWKKSHAAGSAPVFGGTGARWCGHGVAASGYAQPVEDAADRGGADPVTQAPQFALNSLVAPARVIPSHLLHQRGHRSVDRRTPGRRFCAVATAQRKPDDRRAEVAGTGGL